MLKIKLNSTKSMLYFGFAAVVILMVILASVSLAIHKINLQRFDKIVHTNNLKRDLILQMRTAARERTGHLTKMLIVDDVLKLDEEWMLFNDNGSRFMVGYAALKDMPFSSEERVLFDKEEDAMRLIGPIQRRVADLIFNDKLKEAKKLLLTSAIPKQYRAYNGLTKMMLLQQKNAKKSVEEAKQDFYKTGIVMVVLAACIIVVSLLIAYFITRRVTRSEYKLKQAHDKLEQRVLERTEQLSLATENAKNANKAKSDFLSRMSHELRTPLNAILGFSELMANDIEVPVTKNQNDMLREINVAGKHLLGLVNEVLDLASIEAGKLKLNLQDVLLNDVFTACKTLIQPLASERNITIIDEVGDKNKYIILADNTRINQIMLNLMSNAIKYNIEGGSVTLQAEKMNKETLCIKVVDTGLGISEDKLALLFNPYERILEKDANKEGTGLGLNITKQLIELMGGEIGVDSSAEQGTTFWFTVKLLAEL